MEILQLKYFCHAAKTQNISRTAQSFVVSPSSVSVALKKLEEEFGAPLFDRGPNSLKLNACGKILLTAVENAEREIKNARIEILNHSSMPRGEIKLLILTNRSIVTDAMASFCEKYPEVSFMIAHEEHPEYSKHGEYDIIITDKHLNYGDFECKHIVHEEIFLAVPRGSKPEDLHTVSFAELAQEKFICMPRGSGLRDYMEKYFKEAGFEPKIVIESNDPYYICEYLKMGLGVAFFPCVSWRKRIDDRIRLIRIEGGIYRDSYMYTNKASADIVKLFSEILGVVFR